MKGSQYFGVFRDGRDLYTRNLVPGQAVYGERLFTFEGVEYRRWNPARSKLGALLHSGLGTYVFNKGSRVLYLGAATGTTLSHVSDICSNGVVFGVEFSSVSFRKLSQLSRSRGNVIPIMEDASQPGRYSAWVGGRVDVVWQDVSQPDQVRILKANTDMFCKKGTIIYFVLKMRSIDAALPPRDINKKVLKDLRNSGFEIIESRDISRYQRDHWVHVLRV